jgi:hypothetical protein
MPVHQRPAREGFDLNPAFSHPHHCVPRRDALAGNRSHTDCLLRAQMNWAPPESSASRITLGPCKVRDQRNMAHHLTEQSKLRRALLTASPAPPRTPNRLTRPLVMIRAGGANSFRTKIPASSSRGVAPFDKSPPPCAYFPLFDLSLNSTTSAVIVTFGIWKIRRLIPELSSV